MNPVLKSQPSGIHPDKGLERKLVLIAAVFIASVFTTLAFWSVLPSSMSVNESSDFKNAYAPLARNLAAGEGYYLDGYPCTRYPPGYPLVLFFLFSISRVTGI